MPTKFMLGAVAMLANSRSQFPYFRDQFVSRKPFKVFVHIPTVTQRPKKRQSCRLSRTRKPLRPVDPSRRGAGALSEIKPATPGPQLDHKALGSYGLSRPFRARIRLPATRHIGRMVWFYSAPKTARAAFTVYIQHLQNPGRLGSWRSQLSAVSAN